MKISVLTLFPAWFDGFLEESILGRAQESGLVVIEALNIRDWTTDKHGSVDDAPYGGGGGMLMKPEPVAAALDAVAGPPGAPDRRRVIFLSPRGKTWNQERAKRLASEREDFVLLCGRYEGIDERVIESRVDDEISLGDFVLTGGEIAALAVVDSVVRLLPGALGAAEGAQNDSYYDHLLEGPHYTRPPEFEGQQVPEVLLSGHHAEVAKWRREMALKVTRERRPDLYDKWMAENPPKEVKSRRRKSSAKESD